MSNRLLLLAVAATATMLVAGLAIADTSKDAAIKEALSAAPPGLAAVAAVHDWEGNVLREGNSNYVCMPRTPDLEVVNSMCLDEAWLGWASAWMKKLPVKIDTVGTAYMLAGDGGASNIDPFAKAKNRRYPVGCRGAASDDRRAGPGRIGGNADRSQ
jgi:hypothetical protein